MHRVLGILIVAASIALAGCKEDKSAATKRERETRRTADSALLKEPEKAASEFLDRLNQDVQRHDGLIYVNERLLDTLHVYPPHVVWHLQCGLLGMSVAFGGSGENDSEGVEVELTEARISNDQCLELVPQIGRALAQVRGR